jgi:anti-sigma-K factor RskA
MSADHDTSPAAGYVLGTLDPEEREQFARHLATCAECREEVRSLERVSLAMATGVPRRTPRPELRERVLQTVAGAGASYAGAEAPAHKTGAPVGRDFPGRSAAREGGSPGFDPRAWLPLAALLVVAAGLGVYALMLQSRIGSLEARLDTAIRDAAASRAALALAETRATGVQRTMAVLAAPDMTRFDLAGQPVAPAARARAFWSRDRGLVVAANNLPALRPGRTYQVWVLPKSGAPISAGLLVPDTAGVATVAYETAPDLPTPGAVAVSEEPAGGVPAPTGAIVVVGKQS